MKQITINLPNELILEAEQEAARIATRRDGTKNCTRAVLRDWLIEIREQKLLFREIKQAIQ